MLSTLRISFASPGLALCLPAASRDTDHALDAKAEDDSGDESAGVLPPGYSTSDVLGPLAGQLSMGGVMGFCSGYALKRISQQAAFFVGVGFVFLQGLSYFGYVNIKWNKVRRDVVRMVDQDGDGEFTRRDIDRALRRLMSALTHGLPSAAGFSAAFFLGWRWA